MIEDQFVNHSIQPRIMIKTLPKRVTETMLGFFLRAPFK